ncbi:PD-(D/E)XK nuclease family protein [Fusobacterium polymorphum]|uniref:PDDEXK-like family protein n=1 Tax=Fusobacterium nucleatum subsp. polymorphum TaxID=76857 RepID=UPI0030092D4B
MEENKEFDEKDIKKAQKLLKIVKVFEKEYLLKDSPRLNILNIIEMDTKEASAHAKILEFLLDCKWETNEKETLFTSFLGKVLGFSKTKIKEFLKEKFSISREHMIKDGRIDFVIESESLCIAIEMKIYASDGDRQIERYENYCKSRGKDYKIFYLTLDGHEPSEISIENSKNSKVECISFEENILPWLEESLNYLKKEKYKYSFILQYIGAIKNLIEIEEANMEILNTFEEMKTTKFLNDRFKEKIQSIIVEFVEGIDKNIEKKLKDKEILKEDSFCYSGTYNFYKNGTGTGGSCYKLDKMKNKDNAKDLEYYLVFSIEVTNDIRGSFHISQYTDDKGYTPIKFEDIEKIDSKFFNKYKEKFNNLKVLKGLNNNQYGVWFHIKNSRSQEIDFKNFSDSALELVEKDVMKNEIKEITKYIWNIIKDF